VNELELIESLQALMEKQRENDNRDFRRGYFQACRDAIALIPADEGDGRTPLHFRTKDWTA
jgi:hypothetical protein